MKYSIGALIMAMLLTGCSSPNDDGKEQKKELVDATHQPLEKAKGVEQQIFDSDAQQRKQMDDL